MGCISFLFPKQIWSHQSFEQVLHSASTEICWRFVSFEDAGRFGVAYRGRWEELGPLRFDSLLRHSNEIKNKSPNAPLLEAITVYLDFVNVLSSYVDHSSNPLSE